MPSLLHRLTRLGRLSPALRAQLEPERIDFVAERVSVRQRFSGSVPGKFSGLDVSRQLGLLVFTRARLYATLPSAQRLKGPLIDQRWDAPAEGPAQASITADGVRLELDVHRVDTRFNGDLSLHFKTDIPEEVREALPGASTGFTVPPEYVFALLGVRPRD